MSQALARAERIALSEVTPYAWIITRDRDAELSGGESAVGVIGPSTAPDDLIEMAKRGEGTLFRLYDEGDIDDVREGEQGTVPPGHEEYGLVYQGVLVDPTESWPLAPLDDYGIPQAIAITIKLRDEATGEWQEV